MFAAFMTNISRNSDGRSAGHSRNDNDNADADIEMGAPPIRNASYAAGIIKSVVGSARLSFKPSTQQDLESGIQKSANVPEMSQTHTQALAAHTYPPAAQPSQPSQSITQRSIPTTPPHSPMPTMESRPLLSPVQLPNDSQLGEPVAGTGLMVVDPGPIQARSFKFKQPVVASKPSTAIKRPRVGAESSGVKKTQLVEQYDLKTRGEIQGLQNVIKDMTGKAHHLETTLKDTQQDLSRKEELWRTKEERWQEEFDKLKETLGSLQDAREEERGRVAEMSRLMERMRAEDQRALEERVREANRDLMEGNEELAVAVKKAEETSGEMYKMMLEIKGELQEVRRDLDTEKKEKEEALALLRQAKAEVERMTNALDELKKERDEKEREMQKLLLEVGKMGEEVQQSRRQLEEAKIAMERMSEEVSASQKQLADARAEVDRVTNLLEEMRVNAAARPEPQPEPQNQPPTFRTQAHDQEPLFLPEDDMDMDSFTTDSQGTQPQPPPQQTQPQPPPQQTQPQQAPLSQLQAPTQPPQPRSPPPPPPQPLPQIPRTQPQPFQLAPDTPSNDVDMDDLTARPRGNQRRHVVMNPIQPSEVRAQREAMFANTNTNEWVRSQINVLLGLGTARTADTARLCIDDYLATGTIHQQKMLAYDTYHGVGARPEGPSRDTFRVNWKNIKGPWNTRLYEHFEEYAKEEKYAPLDEYGNFAYEDATELRTLFFNRLTAIRNSIVRQVPRGNETPAAATARYELQQQTARARARVNSRREVTYRTRYNYALEKWQDARARGDLEETEKWDKLLSLIKTLGEHGMSSDDSEKVAFCEIFILSQKVAFCEFVARHPVQSGSQKPTTLQLRNSPGDFLQVFLATTLQSTHYRIPFFLTLSIAMSQSQIPAWTIPRINPVTPSVLADYGLAQPDPTDPTKLIDAPLDKSKGRVYKIDGDIYYSPNCSRDGLKAPMFGTGTPECDPRVDKIKNFLTPAYWDSPLTTYLAFMPLYLELGKPPLDALARSSSVYRTRQGFWVDAQQGLGFTRLEHTILKIIDDIAIYFK
ncbi:hypothetical protein CVT24_003046, partial [Panaeolus cyanescens]